jgi:hypothetical protein
VVFTGIVNMGIWWEHRVSSTDGGGEGFTIRGAALDTVLSYEEGLEAAEEYSRKFKK